MFAKLDSRYVTWIRLGIYLAVATSAIALFSPFAGRQARAQAQGTDVAGPSSQAAPTGDPTAVAPERAGQSINLFKLVRSGGIFMIPIFGMSILVVTMTIERFLGLRTSRVLPDGLVTGLGKVAGSQGTFDPRKAYRICQQYPSAAANVVRVMLLKVGRPLTEIESAVQQASQREADKLYHNVRWLNLAASLSVMMGLIGTIQGMIIIFHQMQVMDPSADRASTLAGGIYTKLVCTFAGLSVAIPAAFLSHYFEGRIQGLFREIDELIFNLIPQLERFEGRLRFSRHIEVEGNGEPALEEPKVATPPAPPARPVASASATS
jgi:Biopolymer transport proteins